MDSDRHRRVRKPPPAAPDPTSRRIKAAEELARRGATPGERQAAAEAVGRLRAARNPSQRPLDEPGRSSSEPDIRFTNATKPPPQPTHLLDVLAGLRIQLERTPDKLRYCCRRGCIAVLTLDDVLPGDIPTYVLRCDACDRHLGYVHHRVSDQLRRWVEQGRASVPILRDSKLLR
jgi:hypothetical protein